MEQTALNPVEIIAHAGLERSSHRRSGSRCVIRLDFESGLGILCDLDRIRALMGQTNTQHEMFLFKKMVGRPVDPTALHPIRIFIAFRPAGRMLCDSPARSDTLLPLLRAVDCANLITPDKVLYYNKDSRRASEELGSRDDAGRVQDKGDR